MRIQGDMKRKNYQFIFAIGFLSALLTASACKKKGQHDEGNKQAPPPVVNAPPVVPQPPKEKPVYVYSGDRFRDPFVPAGQSTNYQPNAIFDPQRATVRGIIFGHGYKTAVLTVGGSGSYFVKAGKIFDIMGKTIDGYTAKIFIDKVVIVGEADNIFELKIKTSDEEAKAP
jgi:hypothetical protein